MGACVGRNDSHLDAARCRGRLLVWSWTGLRGQARIVDQDAEEAHKTIAYHGVEVDIPSSGSELTGAIAISSSSIGDHRVTQIARALTVSRSTALTGFDPASGPGVHANADHAKHGDAAFAGYVEAGGTPSMRPTMIGPSWSECWTLSPSAEITSRRGAGLSWLVAAFDCGGAFVVAEVLVSELVGPEVGPWAGALVGPAAVGFHPMVSSAQGCDVVC